jgi:hypothetical protein
MVKYDANRELKRVIRTLKIFAVKISNIIDNLNDLESNVNHLGLSLQNAMSDKKELSDTE